MHHLEWRVSNSVVWSFLNSFLASRTGRISIQSNGQLDIHPEHVMTSFLFLQFFVGEKPFAYPASRHLRAHQAQQVGSHGSKVLVILLCCSFGLSRPTEHLSASTRTKHLCSVLPQYMHIVFSEGKVSLRRCPFCLNIASLCSSFPRQVTSCANFSILSGFC